MFLVDGLDDPSLLRRRFYSLATSFAVPSLFPVIFFQVRPSHSHSIPIKLRSLTHLFVPFHTNPSLYTHHHQVPSVGYLFQPTLSFLLSVLGLQTAKAPPGNSSKSATSQLAALMLDVYRAVDFKPLRSAGKAHLFHLRYSDSLYVPQLAVRSLTPVEVGGTRFGSI